jgi:hypothetical protein
MDVLNQALNNDGETTHNGIRYIIKGTHLNRYLDVYLEE